MRRDRWINNRISPWMISGLAALLLCAGCKREERRFRSEPSSNGRPGFARLSELQPGPPTPGPDVASPYIKNAAAISEGMELYSQMNCVGCHFHGGGGIGPPLMDQKWIYGSDPENVFATIVEGRPNGMPSFRSKLTDDQVWKIVAYVQSLGGLPDQSALPGRPDHLRAKDEGVPNYPAPPLAGPAEHP
jgi:cytochrome c oxidase cbb3-type subunit 3